MLFPRPSFRLRLSNKILELFVLTCMALLFAPLVLAQSPAGANWDHLKAFPVNTRLHVAADHGGSTCKLMSVDDAALLCGKKTFPRSEVKQVKLARYGTSYSAGTAIGAGAGAGILVAVVSGDDFFSNDKGKAAGIGLVLGGVIGALVTGPADLFRGPTVYRRP